MISHFSHETTYDVLVTSSRISIRLSIRIKNFALFQQQKRLLGWETHSQEPKEKEKRVKEKLRGGRKKKRKNKRRRRR